MYYIIRNGQDFGPYDIQAIASYVKTGQILKCDEARDAQTGEVNSVSYFLKTATIPGHIQKLKITVYICMILSGIVMVINSGFMLK